MWRVSLGALIGARRGPLPSVMIFCFEGRGMGLDLRPEQIEALSKLESGKVLCGSVGTGKSRVALGWFWREIESGVKDLYIVTTARKRDGLEWNKELALLGLQNGVQSLPGGILRVFIDSWQNIAKYDSVKDAIFILDEQRLVGSGAWVKAFYKIAKRNKWILLSATPGDTWLDYIPVFVANGFYKNKSEFTQIHVYWKRWVKYPVVEKYVGTKRLERLRDSILVDIPLQKHTTRVVRERVCSFDVVEYKRIMKTRRGVDGKPYPNASALVQAARKVVNSDSSRLSELYSIMNEHRKCIVFYNYNYELELLEGFLASVDWTWACWNGRTHDPLPEGHDWVYLVQYTAGAEGWNCTTCDTIVFYSATYSYKVYEQSMGRIDRMNTPFERLYYYNLTSKSPVDLAVTRALKAKKTFSEGRFLTQNTPKNGR